MNPGYVLERLVLGLTGVCVDVQRIEVTELLDASTMPDPDFVFTVMGMGSDPDRLDLRAGPLAVLFGTLYREAIAFVCDRMNAGVDEIQPDHRVVAAARDLEIGAGVIRAGTVAATEWRWHAISAGRRFLTLLVIWTMDPSLDGYAGRNHWTVDIEGQARPAPEPGYGGPAWDRPAHQGRPVRDRRGGHQRDPRRGRRAARRVHPAGLRAIHPAVGSSGGGPSPRCRAACPWLRACRR